MEKRHQLVGVSVRGCVLGHTKGCLTYGHHQWKRSSSIWSYTTHWEMSSQHLIICSIVENILVTFDHRVGSRHHIQPHLPWSQSHLRTPATSTTKQQQDPDYDGDNSVVEGAQKEEVYVGDPLAFPQGQAWYVWAVACGAGHGRWPILYEFLEDRCKGVENCRSIK